MTPNEERDVASCPFVRTSCTGKYIFIVYIFQLKTLADDSVLAVQRGVKVLVYLDPKEAGRVKERKDNKTTGE